MVIGRRHFTLRFGWCHIVALLAVTVWVHTVAICPEVPEAFGAATQPQPTIHGDRASGDTVAVDLHGSCDHATHASVVLRLSKMIRGGGTIAGPPQPGVAISHVVLVVPTSLVIETARFIDGRPWMRSAAFPGFWPHAPPVTL